MGIWLAFIDNWRIIKPMQKEYSPGAHHTAVGFFCTKGGT